MTSVYTTFIVTSQVPKDIKTTLAENIRAARKTKGLTQRELAALANDVDSLAVSRWERAKAIPNPENFAALSEALDQDVSWFYTDNGIPQTSETNGTRTVTAAGCLDKRS